MRRELLYEYSRRTVVKPKKLRVPAPVLHRPSGQDVVFLPCADGRCQMVYLGDHGSPAAARRYREVLAAHIAVACR